MDDSKRIAMKVFSGAALAVAAAGLFLSGTTGVMAADTKETKVQCTGVNACKGKSECSSAKNGCSGQNACKGQGWLNMTEKQCLDKGGNVEKG